MKAARRTTLRGDDDRVKVDAAPASGERISVVMPVRNALPYLDESIASILGQTHRNFEFVIGDDGSTDGSTDVLRAWAARDSRIRLFERRDGLGPAQSSNWVVAQARHALIARMDADDIAHPDRLRRQLRVLADHPDAALVGSPAVGIDPDGRPVQEQPRWAIGSTSFGAAFAHGSILFRRPAFERAGGYRAECAYWEDLDLYLRMAAFGRILILPDPIYHYRFAATSTRLTSPEERVETAVNLMFRCRQRYERGEGYDALLGTPAGPGRAARILPQVFVSISSGRIWSGQSPGMLGRLLRRGALPTDRESTIAWLIILWGSISPRSLRVVMRQRLRLKNARTAALFVDGTPYEWRSRAIGGQVAAG